MIFLLLIVFTLFFSHEANVISPKEAPQSCASYSTSNTNSGTQNTVDCRIRVCPGTVLTLETCNGNGKSCDGDTYLRLFDGSGYELAANDDRCGMCSAIAFHFRGHSCQEYTVKQGCYGDVGCSGTVQITHESGPALPELLTIAPTPTPTAIPTAAFTPNPTADCVGPFPDHPRCERFIQEYLREKSTGWYTSRGLDGSRCSIQGWLSLKGKRPKCPAL